MGNSTKNSKEHAVKDRAFDIIRFIANQHFQTAILKKHLFKTNLKSSGFSMARASNRSIHRGAR